MKKYTCQVLLSTYNGEKYLEEQLDSLKAQKGVEVSILVRDDGSKDHTLEILEKYKIAGMLEWYRGKNVGPANSFMDLIQKTDDKDFYAFCDQDDYWLDDKIEIATRIINEMGDSSKPILYYGRPRLVDEKLESLNKVGKSDQIMTTYPAALINSNATGCTMVFNKALKDIITEASPSFVGMHDAWIHKVCLAVGGIVYFDEDVHILYRQHGSNVVGISTTKIQMIKNKLKAMKTKKRYRSKIVTSIYECYGAKMSRENRALTKLVVDYPNSIKNRLKLVLNKRIRTGYRERDLMFFLEVILGNY